MKYIYLLLVSLLASLAIVLGSITMGLASVFGFGFYYFMKQQ